MGCHPSPCFHCLALWNPSGSQERSAALLRSIKHQSRKRVLGGGCGGWALELRLRADGNDVNHLGLFHLSQIIHNGMFGEVLF